MAMVGEWLPVRREYGVGCSHRFVTITAWKVPLVPGLWPKEAEEGVEERRDWNLVFTRRMGIRPSRSVRGALACGDWALIALIVGMVMLISLPAGAVGPTILGPSSCATATCHGGVVGVGPVWRSSARIWEVDDPHARAGRVLLSEPSRRLVERLEPRSRNDDQFFMNVLRDQCVSCHATVSDEPLATQDLHGLLMTGVSCEACHGPASQWIEVHVLESFAGPERFQEAPGMRKNDSWLDRVAGCARCHVGSRTADGLVRDVNHDLIAAGHPAMRFDASLFVEWMPAHWDPVRTDRAPDAEGYLQRHLAARYKVLAHVAELSRERLEEARSPVHTTVPFPEFAEYDCRACHQVVSHQVRAGGNLGLSPRWNPWFVKSLVQGGEDDGLGLQATRNESNMSHRKSLLSHIAAESEQTAAALDRHAPRKSLHQLMTEGSDVVDEIDALLWYLQLRVAWRDSAIRETVSPEHAQAFQQRMRKLAPDVIRFGTMGESRLNEVHELNRNLFDDHRSKLLQLLQ